MAEGVFTTTPNPTAVRRRPRAAARSSASNTTATRPLADASTTATSRRPSPDAALNEILWKSVRATTQPHAAPQSPPRLLNADAASFSGVQRRRPISQLPRQIWSEPLRRPTRRREPARRRPANRRRHLGTPPPVAIETLHCAGGLSTRLPRPRPREASRAAAPTSRRCRNRRPGLDDDGATARAAGRVRHDPARGTARGRGVSRYPCLPAATRSLRRPCRLLCRGDPTTKNGVSREGMLQMTS